MILRHATDDDADALESFDVGDTSVAWLGEVAEIVGGLLGWRSDPDAADEDRQVVVMERDGELVAAEDDRTAVVRDRGVPGGHHVRTVKRRLPPIAAGRPIAIRSSVLEFQAAAARLGGGVVLLPDFAVSDADDLQRIEDENPLRREVWLVVHAEIRDVPAIRVVMEALKGAF